MTIAQIHQFCSEVSERVRLTRKNLQRLGFKSEIYTLHPTKLDDADILHIDELQSNGSAILLIKNEAIFHLDALSKFANTTKIFCYDFECSSEAYDYAKERLNQAEKAGASDITESRVVGMLADRLPGQQDDVDAASFLAAQIPLGIFALQTIDEAIGQSQSELLESSTGFSSDLSTNDVVQKFAGAYNILVASEICEQNQQIDMLEVIYHLKQFANVSIRCFFTGVCVDKDYLQRLKARILALHLTDQIVLDIASNSQSFYRFSDCYLHLSKDDELSVECVMAARSGLPLVAWYGTALDEVFGDASLLISRRKSLREFAAAIWMLMQEPMLRRRIIQQQLSLVTSMSTRSIRERLHSFLQQLGFENLPNNDTFSEKIFSDAWQVEGPFDSNYSLSIVNRELAIALNQETDKVALRSMEGAGDFLPNADFLSKNEDCLRMSQRAKQMQLHKQIPDVALRFCYPPNVADMQACTKLIHSYGWEETGFPHAYVDEFNRRLDCISVLSTFVAKTLLDNGVRVPLVVTGAGVDQLLQVPTQALDHRVQSKLKAFRFLHISSCFPRKGVDVLLRAYGATFRSKDNVSLVIKTFKNPHNQVAADLQYLQNSDPDFPHVVLIEEDWSQEQMLALYRACHVFVAPSRGEGFGLPMAEAMLCDLPVITTGWGGQTDFCNDATAWCCDYQFAKANTHLGLTHSVWAEPDQAHLQALMTELFHSSSAEKAVKTQVAKALILQRYRWDVSAEAIRASVSALDQRAIFRNEPKIAWLSTWNARCGIANYSHALCQSIPDNRLTILANHIPERTALDQANVVRCWNAQYDENFENALDVILDRRIGAVVIQYNFGFSATQHMANFIQKLKENHIVVFVFFHATTDVEFEGRTFSIAHMRDSLQAADRVFVHSVDDLNRLKAWGLIDNVVYFPHGIASIVHANQSRVSNRKLIASYGFLLPHKGIRQLIEAFSKLNPIANDYHLLLLNALYPIPASEVEETQCRILIEQLGLEKQVTFITDYLSDHEIGRMLSQADVLVFPYQHTQESSSAAVRVGLSAGCKVAVTPLSIFSDVEEAVYRLPGITPDEIARGLEVLLIDEDDHGGKRAEIETWFAERDWRRLSTRLLNMLDSIANPWRI